MSVPSSRTGSPPSRTVVPSTARHISDPKFFARLLEQEAPKYGFNGPTFRAQLPGLSSLAEAVCHGQLKASPALLSIKPSWSMVTPAQAGPGRKWSLSTVEAGRLEFDPKMRGDQLDRFEFRLGRERFPCPALGFAPPDGYKLEQAKLAEQTIMLQAADGKKPERHFTLTVCGLAHRDDPKGLMYPHSRRSSIRDTPDFALALLESSGEWVREVCANLALPDGRVLVVGAFRIPLDTLRRVDYEAWLALTAAAA